MNALKEFQTNGYTLLMGCRNERESALMMRALKEAAIRAQDFEAAQDFIAEEKFFLEKMPANLGFAFFADIPGATYEAHFNIPRKHVTALHAQLATFGDDCSDFCKKLRASIFNHLRYSQKRFVSIEITMAKGKGAKARRNGKRKNQSLLTSSPTK